MCTQDVEIGEFNIPCGTVVFIPIMNIHHDKRIWESPENFRPERYSLQAATCTQCALITCTYLIY